MGKKKSGNNNNNNNNSDKNNDDNSNNNNGFVNIVLKVDFHCDGCTQRIRKHILNYPGVLKVDMEVESGKVKVMAEKSVDAAKLRLRVEKKTNKRTELVSPQPSKEKKDQNKDDKPKELPLTTVILKVQWHCYGCGDKLYKAVSSYKGVYEATVDKEKDQVKVHGRMEVPKMVEELKKKLNKPVEIVPDKKDQKDKKDGGVNNKENKGDKDNGGNNQKGGDHQTHKIEYFVSADSGFTAYRDGSGRIVEMFNPPQYFSDENANGCSIM